MRVVFLSDSAKDAIRVYLKERKDMDEPMLQTREEKAKKKTEVKKDKPRIDRTSPGIYTGRDPFVRKLWNEGKTPEQIFEVVKPKWPASSFCNILRCCNNYERSAANKAARLASKEVTKSSKTAEKSEPKAKSKTIKSKSPKAKAAKK